MLNVLAVAQASSASLQKCEVIVKVGRQAVGDFELEVR